MRDPPRTEAPRVPQQRVSRRQLLRAGLALGVGLLTSGTLTKALVRANALDNLWQPVTPPRPGELQAWLLVHEDNSVTAFFGKTDLAQGVDTAIAQVVAEELDVEIDSVTVVMGDTGLTCNQGGLSASTACSAGAAPLRNAAAEARRLLLEAAAAQLALAAEELTVSQGRIFSRTNPLQAVTFGQLVTGEPLRGALRWNGKEGNFSNVTGGALPKSPKDYRIVGRPVPRKDLPGKIFGTAEFCHHVSLPDMLHARVVRGPTANATALSYDARSIAGIAGARAIQVQNLLAVVAPLEWDCVRAARELRVQWSTAPAALVPMESLYEHIAGAPVVASNAANAVYGAHVAYDIGPTQRALEQSARQLTAEYRFPFQSHARMAPSVGLASVTSEAALIFSDTQKPHMMRRGLAKLLGLSEEKVRVVWKPGPGSYGRSDADEAAFEAALLSRAVGKPVRVQWMRDEGIAWDPKAPAAVMTVKAGVDPAGEVAAWYFRAKGFSGWQVAQSAANPGDTLAGMLTGFTRSDGHNFAVPEQSYRFPNSVRFWETIAAVQDHASPLRCSHMRGPQEPQVQFASECFIDEVAIAAGQDPLRFRLAHLEGTRELRVLRAAAAASGWLERPRLGSRGEGALMKGRGIAAGPMFGTFVAVVCEVEVERDSGRVWPRRVVVAHDCGLVINPLGLQRTIEGNVIQGLSRTLCEEVRFDVAHVRSVDWDTYPILDIHDVPESVEVVLIEDRSESSSGAGEAAHVFIAPAVGNALFDATGIRYRTIPLTSRTVRAALASRP